MSPSRFLPRFKRPQVHLRVNGLVKAMTLAREQLTGGIPAEDVEEFREFVVRTLENTETICRQYRVTPQALPSPSYQAYQYLKSIDLDSLPVTQTVRKRSANLRVSNLGSSLRHTQRRMMAAARAEAAASTGGRKALREAQALIHQQALSLHQLLKKKQARLEDLPVRSRQMAAWLLYLDQNEQYLKVMEQLVHCCRIYEEIRVRSRSTRKIPALDAMEFEFVPMATLYRWRLAEGKGQLSIHPGFVCASREVLKAILSSVVVRRTSSQSLLIRQCASSPEFLAIAGALEGASDERDGQGQVYDLNLLFEKINRQYFQGNVEKPKLKWSRRFTRRKYGMYLPSTDTVVVSLSLDQEHVPQVVVEYILYHELLHKILGMKETAKRQIAHTREFRRLEHQFRQYDEAQHFLENHARGVSI